MYSVTTRPPQSEKDYGRANKKSLLLGTGSRLRNQRLESIHFIPASQVTSRLLLNPKVSFAVKWDYTFTS